MYNLPNDIINHIWSFDNSVNEYYKNCILQLNKLFNNKKTLTINVTDFIHYSMKNNINYILNKKKNNIGNIDSVNKYKYNIDNSYISEYEIYYKNNNIIYKIIYVKFLDL